MRKRSFLPYLFLCIAIFCILLIPKRASESLRSSFVSIANPSTLITYKTNSTQEAEEYQKLLSENHQLRLENRQLKEWLKHAFSTEKDLMLRQGLLKEPSDDFIKRRDNELKILISGRAEAIPAKVIFRGLSSWDHSLWIDAGEESNLSLGRTVIAKNSPVTIGLSIVGVVDLVERTRSRVRLITDPSVCTSVRVARGLYQNQLLKERLESVIAALSARDDLGLMALDNQRIIQVLKSIQNKVEKETDGVMLAKGELQGAYKPSWRSSGNYLRGVGFNYDFADDEGPARDLRSGKSANDPSNSTPLVRVNDLLITTGMDGVFPAGLYVAEVVKIDVLKEGGYCHDLIAKPTAGSFDSLSTLFVMPPISR